MKLMSLVSKICKTFTDAKSSQLRTVQKVKQNQSRDIVTGLDLMLHSVSDDFVSRELVDCRLLSEEGEACNLNRREIIHGNWLVVDPLDGSNNYALGLPGFGYMAAYLDDACIDSACVVLPEYDQYLIYEKRSLLYSQPLTRFEITQNLPIYYAYPPSQSGNSVISRQEIQRLIDSNSSGMYRCGSACIGLYNLICGKHIAFIGHEIRIWDAIAYLPMLRVSNINVYYALQEEGLTVVAGYKDEFLQDVIDILEKTQKIHLSKYEIDDKIKITSI